MIASVVSLDKAAIKLANIKDPYMLHKFVYDLFPGDRRRFLYYDQGGDSRYRRIILVSDEQPLVPSVGKVESKHIPSGFLEHEVYAFQVLLNPVQQVSGTSRKVPVVGRESLFKWFYDRQQSWGFQVDLQTLDISNNGVLMIHRGKQDITLNKAEFKGILEVTDRERFKYSFSDGMGRGKAFGFGLLQLRPIE